MMTGTHFAPRAAAEAELARMGWTETAVCVWTSPDGDHEASFTDCLGSVVEVRVRRVC